MQKLYPLRYEKFIYFLVEGSQGNFTISPLRSLLASSSMTVTATAGIVTFLHDGSSLLPFPRVESRLPRHPSPCF